MLTSSLTLFRQIFAIFLLSLFVTGAAMADPPIAAVNTEHGLAVKGYDPVSYFTTGKPTAGLAEFSTTYRGATYRFSSAENRDRFIAQFLWSLDKSGNIVRGDENWPLIAKRGNP